MSDILTMAVPILLVGGLALAMAFTKRGVDIGVFLATLGIGICVLIWADIFPTTFLIIPMLLLGISLFIGRD